MSDGPLAGTRIVEGIAHAHTVERRLLDAIDERRLGQPGCFEHGGSNIDQVMELAPNLAAGLEAIRPVHDRAVAGATEMRRHLLRPLVRRVHRVGPSDGVVVIRIGAAELVDV